MDCIVYKAGYKYQIQEAYRVDIPIWPDADIKSAFVNLDSNGRLLIKEGYAWDGPSFPGIDTLNFMRGSLVHDALYQLMREGLLAKDRYRDDVDRLLRRHCREDGMSWLRAWWIYQGVCVFGKPYADPSRRKPKLNAPKGCAPTEKPAEP